MAGSKVLLITGEDATGIGNAANVIRFSKCPGKDYSAALQKDFDAATPDREHELLESLKAETAVRVVASPLLATSIARVNGNPHVFSRTLRGCGRERIPSRLHRPAYKSQYPARPRAADSFCRFLETCSHWTELSVLAGSPTTCPRLRRGQYFGMSGDAETVSRQPGVLGR